MKMVSMSFEILTRTPYEEMLDIVDTAIRQCYNKGTYVIPNGTQADLREKQERNIAARIKEGHTSTIEHCSITVQFTMDRGISHELVRHRLAAVSQESTRYCNYAEDKKGMNFITPDPKYTPNFTEAQYEIYEKAFKFAEIAYNELLAAGASPEEARDVLPNALRTNLVFTANLREWRHIFNMRTPRNAHPKIRWLMRELLKEFKINYPVFFMDLTTY